MVSLDQTHSTPPIPNPTPDADDDVLVRDPEGPLPKVPDARRPSRAAVNALRALLERHDHIVQEVDGQNDFGEDQHVTFTEHGAVTGDVVKIQVKGGRSWRRSDGYAVPVGDHGGTWADGNIPVLCVVHDPETDGLYWANATKQLLTARRNREVLKTITISPAQQLDDECIVDFVAEVRGYLSRYRGNRIIQAQLGEMAGVEFGPSDIVQHHVNVHGEDMIFWQRRGEGFATLLHSDLGWDPQHIGPEHFHPDGRPGLPRGIPVVADTILSTADRRAVPDRLAMPQAGGGIRFRGAGRTTEHSPVATPGARIGCQAQAGRQGLLAEPAWERTRPERLGRLGFRGHTRSRLRAFRSADAGRHLLAGGVFRAEGVHKAATTLDQRG